MGAARVVELGATLVVLVLVLVPVALALVVLVESLSVVGCVVCATVTLVGVVLVLVVGVLLVLVLTLFVALVVDSSANEIVLLAIKVALAGAESLGLAEVVARGDDSKRGLSVALKPLLGSSEAGFCVVGVARVLVEPTVGVVAGGSGGERRSLTAVLEVAN